MVRLRPLGFLLLACCLVSALGSGSYGPAALAAVGADTGFRLPLPPPPDVLTPFESPANPYGSGHRGVDLAAAPGTVVMSAGEGRVIFAGPVAGRGVVSVEHVGGLRTTYEPVDATVAPGAAVTAGGPIGTLAAGHPACAPASCLHWGARLPDRTYLDPMLLLTGWEVRLWPWDRESRG